MQVVCVWVCGYVSKKTNSNLRVWCGGVVWGCVRLKLGLHCMDGNHKRKLDDFLSAESENYCPTCQC